MELRFYEYAGLRVASEMLLPEWAPFERAAPNGTPDVAICLSQNRDHEVSTGAERVVTATECRFAVPGVGSFRVHDGNRIIVAPAQGAEQRQLRPWLIGSAWGSLCYQRGLFLIHASAVMVGNEAVLFCAPAKGGKSTMAAELTRRGYPLLSDDLCHLDIPPEGVPMVYPSVPRLKLWSDAVGQLGWNRERLEPDQSRAGKFHLVEIANTRTQTAPVRGIYLLEWGEFRTSRLSGLAALRRFLAASTYRPELLASAGRYSTQSLSLLQRVPLWELRRPLDLTATRETVSLLASHWSGCRMINQ